MLARRGWGSVAMRSQRCHAPNFVDVHLELVHSAVSGTLAPLPLLHIGLEGQLCLLQVVEVLHDRSQLHG